MTAHAVSGMTVRCLDETARAEHSHPAILLSMEPRPPARGPGRIIFLNGASSSGKSTLAKAMQEGLPEPFLHVSSDHMVASGMLPARRDPDGPFAWWQQIGPRFFDGFHRCLPALAAAGMTSSSSTSSSSAPGASTLVRRAPASSQPAGITQTRHIRQPPPVQIPCRLGAWPAQAAVTGSSAQNDLTGVLYLARDRLALAGLFLGPGHMRLIFGGDAVAKLL